MTILHTQTSFWGGEVSPDFYGRSDLPTYFNSLSENTNALVNEGGSIQKRPGLLEILEQESESVLIPFEVNQADTYIVQISQLTIKVFKNNVEVFTMDSPYTGMVQLENINYAQYLDTLYLVHPHFAPHVLVRTVADTFSLAEQATAPFNSTGNYPRAVTVYQQRLIYGGTVNNPATLYFSKIGEFEDFAEDTDPDSSFSLLISGTENNNILHLLEAGPFLIFTETGVYVLTTTGPLTPTSVGFSKESNIGTSIITKPKVLRNTVFYVTPRGDDILRLKYDFNTNSFTSFSITKAARHLFLGRQISTWSILDSKNLILCTQFTKDADVCAGREIPVCYYDEELNINAWGLWNTAGIIESVTSDVNNDSFYFSIVRVVDDMDRRALEHMTIDEPRWTDPTGPYITTIASLSFEGQNTSIIDKTIVSSIFARVHASSTFWYSADGEYIEYPVQNFSGTIDLPTNSEWSRDNRVFFQARKNAPFQLLSYAVDGKLGIEDVSNRG